MPTTDAWKYIMTFSIVGKSVTKWKPWRWMRMQGQEGE